MNALFHLIIKGTVNIFGVPFPITQVERIDPENSVGRASFVEQRMELIKDCTDTMKENILLHEIIHIIDRMCDCGLTESQVGTIATGLLTVLRENNLLALEAMPFPRFESNEAIPGTVLDIPGKRVQEHFHVDGNQQLHDAARRVAEEHTEQFMQTP